MSTIDQAFIRAYRDDAVAPKAVLWLSDAASGQDTPAPENIEPAVALGSTVNVGPAELSAGSVAIIDVGAETIIPPPHAAFMPRGAAPDPILAGIASPKAPLSSFAGATTRPAAATKPIKPAFEVETVRWPAACGTLLAQYASRFDGLAEEICGQSRAGRRVVAISGTRRAEGRTTLALCLARRLAAMNLKVAVVDADFDNPNLARQLGIAVESGWEAVLAGEESLWEVMIELLADRFSLVPLAVAAGEVARQHSYRLAATLHELADAYEVVLVDAGPLDARGGATHWLLEAASGVDTVLLAHDVRHGEAAHLAAACLRLAEARQRQIGIAEMFVEGNT